MLATMTIRLAACSLVAVACLLTSTPRAAAEGWWPGGGDKEPAASAPAKEAATEDSTMIDSSMFKLSWPKVEMPKFSWKPSFGGDQESALPSAEGNPISRALDKVATSSKNASEKVRGAWGSAMSKLPSFGSDKATQTAKSDKPGFWSRLLTPPADEAQGSETVQQFLAQERVGTTR